MANITNLSWIAEIFSFKFFIHGNDSSYFLFFDQLNKERQNTLFGDLNAVTDISYILKALYNVVIGGNLPPLSLTWTEGHQVWQSDLHD